MKNLNQKNRVNGQLSAVKSFPHGFTLVELIIVIAIIAILAAAIFVAIDPARRLHESRNARRSSDVYAILDALKQYQADHAGTHYTTVNSMGAGTYYQIGTGLSGCRRYCGTAYTPETCVDLSDLGDNYLAIIPKDPSIGTDSATSYGILKGTSGSLTIIACEPEGIGPGGTEDPPEIQATR